MTGGEAKQSKGQYSLGLGYKGISIGTKVSENQTEAGSTLSIFHLVCNDGARQKIVKKTVLASK